MPEVVRLLRQFSRTWPPEYDVARAQIFADVAGGDASPGGTAGSPRDISGRGVQVAGILRTLCGTLGIAELDALFADTTPTPGVNDTAPVLLSSAGGSAVTGEDNGYHLLGLICVLLAGAYEYRALADPGGRELGAAALCYKHALSCFLGDNDDWNAAWTRYMLGVVVSRRGGDPVPLWDQAAAVADAEGDTELMANIERGHADYLRSRGDLNRALVHYGRSVYYGLSLPITLGPEVRVNQYIKASYREMCSHAAKVLAEALLADQAAPREARLAEASRRLSAMLDQWSGAWEPDDRKLAAVFGLARREQAAATVDAIADVAFPPGPDDTGLGFPLSEYLQQISALVRQIRTQPWVRAQRRLDAVLSTFP